MFAGYADEPIDDKRLDSWKSIAHYLGRSCRTVQRWQVQYGLPVRHVGGATGSVFAYIGELESWLKNRLPTVKEDQQEAVSTGHFPSLKMGPSLGLHFACDCAKIPEESKVRSSALVRLAVKMLRDLSYNSLEKVARTFREAIEQDCTNPSAYAGISFVLILHSILGGLDPQTALTASMAGLRRAMELEPELPEIACTAGWLKIFRERDWEGALEDLERPDGERWLAARVQVGLALLSVAHGELEKARALFHQASVQSALNVVWSELECWGSYLSGEYVNALRLIGQSRASGLSGPLLDAVEALALVQMHEPASVVEQIEVLRANAPHNPVVQGVLGYTYGLGERTREAQEILRSLTHPGFKEQNHYAVALVLIGLKQNREAVKRLKRSFQDGSLWSVAFRSDPMLHSLHRSRCFWDFIFKANYPVSAEEPGSSDQIYAPCQLYEENGEGDRVCHAGCVEQAHSSSKVM